MCKTKKVLFIDSNNRNANSASETDFEIDLDHPLILPAGCGVAIDAMSLPNTSNIDPVVPGVNNKLYCELGIIFKTLELTDDGTDLAAFASDLQAALNTQFPLTPALNNVPLQWQRHFSNSGEVFTEDVTYNGAGFQYVYRTDRILEFTAFDISDTSATLTETRAGSLHDTFQWNQATKTFVAQNSSYDWKLSEDSTIFWEGIHPNAQNLTQLVTASESSGTLTVAPVQATGQLKILTDFELKHGTNPLSDNEKRNLKSANKYILNLGSSSPIYSLSSPFQREVDVNRPAFDSIFIRSNLNVDNGENIIKKIPLGSINETNFFGEYDITTEGKITTRLLTFRVTDANNNLINFHGETLSFRLAFIY